MADNRRDARHPIGLLVKLRFPDMGTFVERFATNVSRSGMFIRTREPREVGTVFSFEIRIAGGLRVLGGKAVVRWQRRLEDGSGAAGMGLEFLSMDEASQAVLDRMIALKEEGAGPASAPTSVGGAKEEEATSPSASTEQGQVRAPPSSPEPAAIETPSPPPAPAEAAAPPHAAAEEEPAAIETPSLPHAPAEAAAPPSPTPAEAAAPPHAAAEREPSLAGAGGVDESDLVASTPPPPAHEAGPPAPAEIDLDVDLEVDGANEGEVDAAPPAPPSIERPPSAPAPSAPAPEDSDDEEDIDVDLDMENDGAMPAAKIVFLKPPESLPGDGPVIGIDLGTTNSCVAAFRDGKPGIMKSPEGYNTVPSIVAISSKGRLLVGHPAKGQMLTNPHRTVYGAKRLVGRRFDSDTVQLVSERFHYPICADASGHAAVLLDDHVISLEEVQGLVLAECKSMAQEALSQPVHRAVITVPAYYSDAQRNAVREAGRLAGLQVERILNEPTAAALAYGLNRELKKTVLVYDLGGGTFDATAMQIDGNVFEVLATGGDTFLGGVDFDNLIVDWLINRFEETTGREFAGDQVALSRIADAAERAKVELSQAHVHEVNVPFLMMDGDGVPVDLRCTVTRDDIEALTEDLVERSLDVVRDVLLDGGLKPADVEDVILVGGQSRMPLVRQRIGQLFGREPHPGVHPDEAIGLGAALLAGSIDKISSIVLIDVLPMTIGIGLPGGRFKRIIERNTPLPVHKTYGIVTSKKNQKEIVVSIFQGEEEHVSGNEYLGTLRLTGLPRGPKGSVRVAVTFDLGPECVLEVAARDVATGQEVRASMATRDTPEAIRKRLGIEEGEAESRQAARGAELSKRGGRFWRALRRMVGAG